MTRLDIRLICAMGKSSQIGLNGKLPWNDREDMDFFKSQIRGGIVIVGRKTAQNMPELYNCIVDVWHGKTIDGGIDPARYLKRFEERYKDWPQPPVIWIAGGASIYEQWAPYVKRMVISNLDYNGPADSFFPWKSYQNIKNKPDYNHLKTLEKRYQNEND